MAPASVSFAFKQGSRQEEVGCFLLQARDMAERQELEVLSHGFCLESISGRGRMQGPSQHQEKSQASALCFSFWLARASDTSEHLSFHTLLSWSFDYIVD